MPLARSYMLVSIATLLFLDLIMRYAARRHLHHLRAEGRNALDVLPVGSADSIGPVLLGLKKPVHVLQLGSSIRSIFNVVLIAVVDAQMKCQSNTQEAINNSKWWKHFKKTAHEL